MTASTGEKNIVGFQFVKNCFKGHLEALGKRDPACKHMFDTLALERYKLFCSRMLTIEGS